MKTNGTDGIPEYARSQSSAINNYTIMEKNYKRVPFDIELAKKIQSGEVEGRIVTSRGFRARLLATDLDCYYCLAVAYFEGQVEDVGTFDKNGNYWNEEFAYRNLFIELSEEAPKHKIPTIPTYEQWKEKEILKHKFKVGDKVIIHIPNGREEVVRKHQGKVCTVIEITDNGVYVNGDELNSPIYLFNDEIKHCEEKLQEKETQKHEFKPFDKVLVRNTSSEWQPKLYSQKCILGDGTYDDGYMSIDEKRYRYCIPYEGNEHLLGTTYKPKY